MMPNSSNTSSSLSSVLFVPVLVPVPISSGGNLDMKSLNVLLSNPSIQTYLLEQIKGMVSLQTGSTSLAGVNQICSTLALENQYHFEPCTTTVESVGEESYEMQEEPEHLSSMSMEDMLRSAINIVESKLCVKRGLREQVKSVSNGSSYCHHWHYVYCLFNGIGNQQRFGHYFIQSSNQLCYPRACVPPCWPQWCFDPKWCSFTDFDYQPCFIFCGNQWSFNQRSIKSSIRRFIKNYNGNRNGSNCTFLTLQFQQCFAVGAAAAAAA